MTTVSSDLEVYIDRNGRRYVVDHTLPPGATYDVLRVKALHGLRIWVEFHDGEKGEVDLSDIADDSAVVDALWADREYFETVHILDYGGVAWAGEKFDISPTVLYMRVTGKPLQEVCPQVRFVD